ncbi:hypothetical protein DICPUDRAFT_35222 [Dictyostelium purpureum]|uniref:Carbohydrate binding domain-containing protein n=1 Tax=Dictyostelium purpureum TaxID=5786 RepID=F0ZP26_DICPU|nr:uncharacterized protein DICPUDRAFT_35222 [Dictyostelium purpureum]EGC34286.1 hypothetical protein DICPUDRAFT_35222 [Dictyostelium purpureum]|eukprot:XP_003289168.1 hypothetical protein DICPUDRAFT_35222 [Dictyostelium purpureum]
MKLLSIILGLLLIIAFVSAQDSTEETFAARPTYPCGSHSCDYGHVCRTHGNECGCVPHNNCEVTLKFKFIGSWVDGSCGKTYTQYDVIIQNGLNRNIKDIYIGSDYTLRLRDHNSIWNIVRLPNGVLTLPSYQQSINAGASYTFGFIIEGTQRPNLRILAVTFF